MLGQLQYQGVDYIQRSVSFDDTYLDSEFTKNNRAVIRNWSKHAQHHDYNLIFVLIPPPTLYTNTSLYRGLKLFLAKNNIRFIDLTKVFSEAEFLSSDIYWYYDGHLNDQGNALVGKALAEYASSHL